MDTRSLDLVCNAATAAESRDTALETLPVREMKEKCTRMRRNGTASKMGHEPKVVKAKGKERKA